MAYGIEQGRIPTVTLRGGERVPCLGLGTFGSDKYGPEEIAEAVYGAVRYGYRFIDCAAVYQNEDRIGQALGRLFSEGAVERRELFITSKVWNDMHGAGQVMASCKKSLADLGLDYLDLYFVHWPFPNYHAPGCAGDSRNPDSRPFSVEEFMATWRQCEELVDKGLVRYIGMSNMTVPKLEAVLPLCRIQPAALEMELHPSFQQPELFAYAREHGILPIGYCPIGSPSRPERDRTAQDVADGGLLRSLCLRRKLQGHLQGLLRQNQSKPPLHPYPNLLPDLSLCQAVQMQRRLIRCLPAVQRHILLYILLIP